MKQKQKKAKPKKQQKPEDVLSPANTMSLPVQIVGLRCTLVLFLCFRSDCPVMHAAGLCTQASWRATYISTGYLAHFSSSRLLPIASYNRYTSAIAPAAFVLSYFTVVAIRYGNPFFYLQLRRPHLQFHPVYLVTTGYTSMGGYMVDDGKLRGPPACHKDPQRFGGLSAGGSDWRASVFLHAEKFVFCLLWWFAWQLSCLFSPTI